MARDVSLEINSISGPLCRPEPLMGTSSLMFMLSIASGVQGCVWRGLRQYRRSLSMSAIFSDRRLVPQVKLAVQEAGVQ